MKVRYVKNGNYYVLTNFAASGNPIFINQVDVLNFKKRLKKHLEGLVTILESEFRNDHYKLLVLLESRKNYVEFYRKKKNNQNISETDIPESTYILSQEMANIQSGYAKWFNFKYGRFGVVFGRRFTKLLINGKKELENWAEAMWHGVRYWKFKKAWSYKNCYIFRKKGRKKISSGEIFLDFLPNELRGRLGNSP